MRESLVFRYLIVSVGSVLSAGLISCASTATVAENPELAQSDRQPAQVSQIISHYSCPVTVVGTSITDKIFLDLSWSPGSGPHPVSHSFPSRKTVAIGIFPPGQPAARGPRAPLTPIETFLVGIPNQTNHEPWGNTFRAGGSFSARASNFALPAPGQPYTLGDFAKFEDDSNDGIGGPNGQRYEFLQLSSSNTYSMKYTQFDGGLAASKIQFQLSGNCSPL